MTRWKTASIAPLAVLTLAACAGAQPQVMGKSPDRITIAVKDRAALRAAAITAGDHCVAFDDIAVLRSTEEAGGVVLAHFDCR